VRQHEFAGHITNGPDTRHVGRHRIGWFDPGQEQPTGRGQNHCPEPCQLPQDDPEPVVGSRLQHHRLAAGALAPWGINISPAFNALLMSLSTIIVAINAQLLNRQENLSIA
jgi:hypothetical protein